MSARDDLVDVVAELRQIAADIAKANINGFGNAITAQADRLEAMLDAEPVAWIPVSERLPETDTYVLAIGPLWEEAQKTHFALHDGEAYWDSRHHRKHFLLREHPFTHWMPLPARPEASDETI